MSGLLSAGLWTVDDTARRVMLCDEAWRVRAGGAPADTMPSPLALSSFSAIVGGVMRSTAVASLARRAYPGREGSAGMAGELFRLTL
jgi:hypothetical protein